MCPASGALSYILTLEGRRKRSSSISRVAVRTGTGGDAPHTREEIQGTRVLNSSGGTIKSTRLTSKYVLRGKTKKAKIIIKQLK